MRKLVTFCLAGLIVTVLGLGSTTAVWGARKLILWSVHTAFTHYNKYFETEGEKFAKLHPEIKGVDVVVIPYAGYISKYLTAFMGKKEAPDIFEAMTHQWAGLFQFADPMPEDFAKTIEEEQVPYVAAQGVVGGERYGVPTEGCNFMMQYINIEMFEEAGLDPNNLPKNFDELLECAKKLTKSDAAGEITRSGFAIRYAGHPIGITDKFTPFLHGMGASLVAPDFSTATGYTNSPEAVNALTWYTNLVGKWKVSSTKLGLPSEAFAQKLAAIIFREGWYAGYLRDNAPDVYSKIKVSPCPQNENSLGPTVYPLFPWVNMVYRYSPYKDLAWEFLRYMWTAEHDLKQHKVQDMFPVWKKNLDTEYGRTRPYYGALVQTLKDTPYAPHYYHPTQNKIAFTYGDAVLDALFGRASAEVALEMATAEINLLLEK